ncbi:MAG: type II secretion system protein GspL [Pseudomonadota bacterium]
MPRLYIRLERPVRKLPDDEGFDIAVEWLIKENDGRVRGHGQTDYRGLEDLADPNVDWLADPNNTVVFLPSEFVLTLNCEVPGRSATQIRRALPFAVEEFVAGDIEDMHIAYQAIKPGAPVLCNVVSHAVMQDLLNCFGSVGVVPGVFVTDTQMLQGGEGVTTVLFEDESVVVAHNNEAAAIDRDTLSFALAGLDSSQLITINDELSDLDLSQLDPRPEVEYVPPAEGGTLGYLADTHRSGVTYVNLLQQQYKPSLPQSSASRRWGSVMALAAVWLFIALLGLVVQGFWAGQEADRLEAENFALYTSLFPGERTPGSLPQLRRNMNAKLGRSTQGEDGGASAFVGLAAHFAQAITVDNQVTSLNYEDARGELTVEVMLDSYDDLEGIKSRLGNAGVAVDVTNAEEEGTKVRSRMRVRYAS